MKREVATFTFKDKHWEAARSDLLPYVSPIGLIDLTYNGPPLPEGADVEVPRTAPEMFSFIGQGMNFDVTVYRTSGDPPKYQVDITKVWR